MANRCKKCGVPLSEGAKFCRNCGTPVMQPESAGIKPESRRTEPQRYTPPQPQPYQQAGPETDNLTGNQQKSKRKLFGRQAKATSQKQTRTFAAGTSAAAAGAAYAGGQAGNAAASERTAAPGPAYADGRYPGLGEYLKSYIRKISDILKDPKQLLPTIVLGAIWMVLSIVGSFFWRLPLPLSILSFLTYAQGGMYGGFLAAAGGIVGKVVVAAFLNAMIMPLFKGGKPFDGVAGGIGGVFKGAAVQGIQELSPLTLGVGAALVLYGFMNSRQSLQEAMVGIVAVIMLLKNIGTKGGFMTGLIFSAAQTFSGGRIPSRITADRVLSGLTIGFTLAVALSVLPFRPCVWVGLILLAISIVTGFLGKGKKQAAAAGET